MRQNTRHAGALQKPIPFRFSFGMFDLKAVAPPVNSRHGGIEAIPICQERIKTIPKRFIHDTFSAGLSVRRWARQPLSRSNGYSSKSPTLTATQIDADRVDAAGCLGGRHAHRPVAGIELVASRGMIAALGARQPPPAAPVVDAAIG
jgi:hypothetical protein